MGCLWGCAAAAVAGVFGARVCLAEPPNPRQYEGRPVAAVVFEPADQPLTQEELAGLVALKPGAPFTVPDLRASIKRLFATGRFADVEATGEPRGDGLAVRFRTREQWFVGRVDARGVDDDPARGELAEAARLELGNPLSDEELDQATGRVRDLLRRNGLYEATVEASLDRNPEHQIVNIRFHVDRGKRAEFATPAVNGDPKLEAEKVVDATKWRGWFGWKDVTEERVQDGLQRIRKKYQDEDRLAAEVVIEGMDYDPKTRKLTPRLRVTGGPKVDIRTEGADVSDKKLKRYVPVFVEGAVDRDLLVEGARNLRDYFQNQGYYDVAVDFKQNEKGPDEREVVYLIDLGPRQKLVDIQVQGNKYFDTPTIRERMMLHEAGMLRLRNGRYSEAAVRRDESSIKALYESNGFRDVKISTRAIPKQGGDPGEMAVVVTIEEGPQYLVSEFEAAGFEQIAAERFKPELSSMTGQPFSEVNVALDRDFILRTYQTEGYPDARFDWEVRPGAAPNQVEVRYRINEGRKREVRDVIVAGTDITRQRLIRPAMTLQPGTPLSQRDMFQAQRDLYELGIFEKVDVAVINPEGATDRKNVIYQFTEGHRYYVAGGFGAEVARIGGSEDSYDAPAGATGFSPRVNFDVSRLNLWGLGHSLNFKSRVSTLQKRALLNYAAPRYKNVEGRNLSFNALYDDSRDVRTFSAKRWEASVQASEQLTRATTMLLRYSFRRSTVDPNTLKISPLLVPLATQPVRIGMIAGNWIQDRRDDPADSHEGVYNTADVGLASRWFASQRNFLRMLLRNATYHPFGRGNEWVIARNAQFGWIAPYGSAGLDPVQSVPLPERFFGGGSTSHRGFPDNQAGPRDLQTGFPLGGNSVVFHNTELRFPLLGDNINGVFFHDMGNVFSSPGKISFRVTQRDVNDFDYMVHAVGFGVRYRTPVGPVRVDLAYSVNPPRFWGLEGDRQAVIRGEAERTLQRVNRFQFFFSIGQTF